MPRENQRVRSRRYRSTWEVARRRDKGPLSAPISPVQPRLSRAAGCPRKLHGPGRGAEPWLPLSGPPPPRTPRGGSAARPRPPDGAQAPRKREAAPGPPPQREQCGASGCSAARDPGARSPERGRPSERPSGRAKTKAGERAAVPPQSHGRGAARGCRAARLEGAGGRGEGLGPPLAGSEGAGPGNEGARRGKPVCAPRRRPAQPASLAGRRAAGDLGARRFAFPKM